MCIHFWSNKNEIHFNELETIWFLVLDTKLTVTGRIGFGHKYNTYVYIHIYIKAKGVLVYIIQNYILCTMYMYREDIVM